MDINEGELIEATNKKGFKKIFQFYSKQKIQLQGGFIDPEDIINSEEGDTITASDGLKYHIFKPTIHDYIMYGVKRQTQIIYPKEAGYIILKLDIRNSKVVGEAGTGSGSLTLILSELVSEKGRIITFEKNLDFLNNARKNIEKFSKLQNITFVNEDFINSNYENFFDSFFMDLKDPWFYFEKVSKALKRGGNFGLIVPTTNQVNQSINELESNNFLIDEIVEIFHRKYKINPNRLRPEDIMTGHTGYLIFAKKVK
ncbi:tRNA (adenine-58-N(1)-) methyltransferase [Thermodesulfobium acidiphilum]|uniref:tRNA (adenine(58)-N(1))-methyltransferase TrmI n=1 Tax=Thermodesulfobium acidiphilum TaxID=1794699 RepID=A0A2R4W159_THEAF|nr:methyltransferase domain-containing protein [Thermodesulfobium acidiphilum]AWB10541.1 tRNA (adenine-58-N(1)-) methyltransferase [Thermodesulfobium acidiphilum]